MSVRKPNSTNSVNETYWKEHCNITHTFSLFSSRWKGNILIYLLKNHTLRYSDLRKMVVGISERVLISKLKELEKDGLITRVSYQELPHRVEYQVTALGYSLEPILIQLDQWGEQFME